MSGDGETRDVTPAPEAGAEAQDEASPAAPGSAALGTVPKPLETATAEPSPTTSAAAMASDSATGAEAVPAAGVSPAILLPSVETAAAAAPWLALGPSDADVDRQLARLSRRGFLTLAAGGTAAVLGWRWLISRPAENGQPWPFRRALQANEALWGALWDPTRLAPTYPRSAASPKPRVNGGLGLDP